MSRFGLRLHYSCDRPCVNITDPIECSALLDTGGTLPIMNVGKVVADKCGRLLDKKPYKLKGLGSGDTLCYQYRLSEWRFGHFIFTDMLCLVPTVRREDLFEFIIPACVLSCTSYTIDTINNLLIVDYPKGFEKPRKLHIHDSDGKLVPLTTVEVTGSINKGNTSFDLLKSGISVYDYELKDKDLESTLDFINNIRDTYINHFGDDIEVRINSTSHIELLTYNF